METFTAKETIPTMIPTTITMIARLNPMSPSTDLKVANESDKKNPHERTPNIMVNIQEIVFALTDVIA